MGDEDTKIQFKPLVASPIGLIDYSKSLTESPIIYDLSMIMYVAPVTFVNIIAFTYIVLNNLPRQPRLLGYEHYGKVTFLKSVCDAIPVLLLCVFIPHISTSECNHLIVVFVKWIYTWQQLLYDRYLSIAESRRTHMDELLFQVWDARVFLIVFAITHILGMYLNMLFIHTRAVSNVTTYSRRNYFFYAIFLLEVVLFGVASCIHSPVRNILPTDLIGELNRQWCMTSWLYDHEYRPLQEQTFRGHWHLAWTFDPSFPSSNVIINFELLLWLFAIHIAATMTCLLYIVGSWMAATVFSGAYRLYDENKILLVRRSPVHTMRAKQLHKLMFIAVVSTAAMYLVLPYVLFMRCFYVEGNWLRIILGSYIFGYTLDNCTALYYRNRPMAGYY